MARSSKRLTRGRAAKRSSTSKKNSKNLGVVLKKFKFQQKIAKSNLRSGMIIQFKYSGKFVHDPTPLVLVLNPRFLGKLHGINLNYCNYSQILKISKIVNEKIDQQALKLRQKFKMTSPHGFYHKQLKHVIRKFSKSIYRTYFYSSVKQPTLMDFKFNAPQGKQQLVIRSIQGKVQTIVQKMGTKTVKNLPKRKNKDIVKTVHFDSNIKTVKPKTITNVQKRKNVIKNVKKINSSMVNQVGSSIVKKIKDTD